MAQSENMVVTSFTWSGHSGGCSSSFFSLLDSERTSPLLNTTQTVDQESQAVYGV